MLSNIGSIHCKKHSSYLLPEWGIREVKIYAVFAFKGGVTMTIHERLMKKS